MTKKELMPILEENICKCEGVQTKWEDGLFPDHQKDREFFRGLYYAYLEIYHFLFPDKIPKGSDYDVQGESKSSPLCYLKCFLKSVKYGQEE